METLKSQGALKAFWIADTQRSKFEDLRDRIKRALDQLSLGAAVSTNVLLQRNFNQSKEVSD